MGDVAMPPYKRFRFPMGNAPPKRLDPSLVVLQAKANIGDFFAGLPQSCGGQWIARLFSDPCLSYPIPARLQESLRSVVAAVFNVRRCR
jgi:hypothetical protein